MASDQLIAKVNSLIMSTLHNQGPKHNDHAYMMDIDISILGSDKEDYQMYSDNIRKEYKSVPWFMYRKNRIRILKMFLDRDHLFYTDIFSARYEEPARINIENEIHNLEG